MKNKHMYKHIIFIITFSIVLFFYGWAQSYTSVTQPPPDTLPLHTYYVATTGNDSNPGTIGRPFKTWSKAWAAVVAGDIVYIRGGVYYPDPVTYCSVVMRYKSGMPGKYIRFFAYPGETPILDCSNMIYKGSIPFLRAIDFKGDYWYFRGLEIRGVPQSVDPVTGHGYVSKGFVAQDSNFCIFENLNCHHNGGTGFLLGGNSNNNLILNSDFHHNYDPYSYENDKLYFGGNADGCEIAGITKGCSNIISGCRFWWNSDDGLDLWRNEGNLIVQNCWSFWNGYQPGTFTSAGDGVGFKLGKTFEAGDSVPQRVIRNCVAYANRRSGFDQNYANVLMVFYNNTSYKNSFLGFRLSYYPSKHIIKNNISYANYIVKSIDYQVSSESDQTNNSWNGFLVTRADFLTIVPSGIDGARMPDGKLPNINFLKLAPTSGLVGKGVDVGLPFSGSTPNIGAY
ncbi:MAG: right-handed parallel beta-helix repeat-containing protein [Proteobacteria bacterium]|nr:right-handed parallel beta-helix repeat-containing protein [Pseudomonadota bacterium]